MRAVVSVGLGLGVVVLAACGGSVRGQAAGFENGLPDDPAYFPIGVWLQAPSNAARFKAAGINLYIGLWQGPTAEQLRDLEAAEMPVICAQNEVGLAYEGDMIVGWMHGDEPDNAQSDGQGGWGPCIPPQRIVDDYHAMRAKDPTRPVLLNLGQGVANDEWIGRGAGAKLSDYETYVLGGDIISFDVYPVAGIGKPDGENYLWYVAKGVERLRGWTPPERRVWAVLECTHIGSDRIATPAQVRSMAWMAICRGATGLVYFVHQFQPNFVEAALLQDPEMLAGVTALNAEIRGLAPVLHSGALDGVTVTPDDDATPVAMTARRHEGATYVLSVGLRNQAGGATFAVPGAGDGEVEVLGENRALDLRGGRFSDRFEPYAVHLYRVAE